MTPQIMGCPGQQVQSSKIPSLGWRAQHFPGLKGREQQLLRESVAGVTCLSGNVTVSGITWALLHRWGRREDESETRTSSELSKRACGSEPITCKSSQGQWEQAVLCE